MSQVAHGDDLPIPDLLARVAIHSPVVSLQDGQGVWRSLDVQLGDVPCDEFRAAYQPLAGLCARLAVGDGYADHPGVAGLRGDGARRRLQPFERQLVDLFSAQACEQGDLCPSERPSPAFVELLQTLKCRQPLRQDLGVMQLPLLRLVRRIVADLWCLRKVPVNTLLGEPAACNGEPPKERLPFSSNGLAAGVAVLPRLAATLRNVADQRVIGDLSRVGLGAKDPEDVVVPVRGERSDLLVAHPFGPGA
ncbi:MAG: hypothetical protein AAFV53_13115 [Myxococcota bacterium]